VIERDDRTLVAAITSRNDERAFAELYARHTTAMWRLALRLTGGDEPAAEDAVHDAWVKAVEKLRMFTWRSTLRTWLSGFVVNMVREHTRSVRDDADVDAELPDGDTGDALLRIDIDRALTSLSPGYRQVLVLHDIEGFTHGEIAGMMGIDAGTSKSQLTRARRRMRALLGGLGS
jgi:RNA polymerase sigma-70 factor (ECF subfamily)